MYQVVIVDDEPFVLEDLKKSIDWEGSNFEIAYADTDPQHVLSYIHSHTVDLLITDINMPEMSGPTLITEDQSHPAVFCRFWFCLLMITLNMYGLH